MADVKISELDEAATIGSNDSLVGIQGVKTKRFKIGKLLSSENITFDNTGTGLSANQVQEAITEVNSNKVPSYGMGKNLLDNWYFVSPVNQRRATSYTGAAYSVDRWYLQTSGSTVSLRFDGVNLSKGTANACEFCQALEQRVIDMIKWKNLTLSWLDDDGFHSVPVYWSGSQAAVYTGDYLTVYTGGLSSAYSNIMFSYTSTWLTIQAVKLELGTQSTLCHNEGTDANPVWVLNEIPDYEEELIKCQTSTADSTDTYANKTLATEQQLAYVESGTTASRNYSVKEYFCMGGALYKVISPISSGVSFNAGSGGNCVAVGDKGGLNSVLEFGEATALVTNHQGTGSTGFLTVPDLRQFRYLMVSLDYINGSVQNSVVMNMLPLGLVVSGIGVQAEFYDGTNRRYFTLSYSSPTSIRILNCTNLSGNFYANIYGIK